MRRDYYISSLDLSQNPLGNESIEILAKGIINSTSLLHLNLRSTAFRKEGADALFKALTVNCTVTCLYIGNIKGLHRNILLGKAVSGIEGYLRATRQLIFLDLAGAGIGNEGFAYVLNGLRKNMSLKVLNLVCNNIDGQGSENLFTLIVKTMVKHVDLSQNPLGDSFIAEMLPRMKDTQFFLTHLGLRFCDLASPGIGKLFSILRRGLFLVNLDLDGIKCDETEIGYIGWLMINCYSLCNFSLTRCNFGDNGIKYISEGFRPKTVIQYINLSHNKIGDDGISFFCRNLKQLKNTKLKSIDLSNNNIRVIVACYNRAKEELS